jgi:hypothetical protein
MALFDKLQYIANIDLYLTQCHLTNSMELRPSWNTDNSSAIQEIPSILRNPMVHYFIYKIPQLVSSWLQSATLNSISLSSV